jgi:glutamate-1-semialdehyde 2,1-aminomutase
MSLWHKRSAAVLAQGETGTNSKRRSQFIEGVYPTHLARGQGCYVWDTENIRYIDFIGGLGTMSLGYNNPKVNEALDAQIKTGIITGSLPHYKETEVAETVCQTFGVDAVRFLKNGDDATMAAVRIARTYTQRSWIYSDGYHGRSDLWVSLTPPALGVSDSFCVKDNGFNNPKAFEEKPAAYIFEGLNLRDDETETKAIAERVDTFRKKNALIVSDEIVTNCRVENFTANQRYRYQADLVCLGKGMANGLPLSVVGGKKEIMNCGEYFISSTFSGEALSLVACQATLEEIKRRDLRDLNFYAKRFMAHLNDSIKPLGFQVQGYGTRGMLPVTHPNCALFMQEALKAGMLFGKAFFYNFSHMEQNGLEETVFNLISDVVAKIQRGDVKLEGKAPVETFKR